MYFGDLGKSAKDILTGGFQYDHKGSYAMKTDSGVTLTVNGKKKGDAVAGDLKASTKINGATVDAGLSGGKLETTVTMDEVTPGLKAALSASLPEVDSGKLALTYSAIKDMGLKCDVGLKSGAKFNANACMVTGPLALGGALCLDTGKGQLSKFELGAQYDVTPASTFTGMLLDSVSDLKFSYFYKVKADLSVGAECKYSISKGAAAYLAASRAAAVCAV